MEAKYSAQVKVFYSATCDSIERVQGGSGIEVRVSLDGKETGDKVFRPRLLVGADGLKSMVSGFYTSTQARAVVNYVFDLMGGLYSKGLGMRKVFPACGYKIRFPS